MVGCAQPHTNQKHTFRPKFGTVISCRKNRHLNFSHRSHNYNPHKSLCPLSLCGKIEQTAVFNSVNSFKELLLWPTINH